MKYGRKILEGVEGYVPGEQPGSGEVIKLNTNENPYGPSPQVREALATLSETALRTYPDPLSLELRTACAARYGFDGPEWVMAGNGMDELLSLALRTFVDPGQTVVSTCPTYTLYEVLTRLHGAEFRAVELDDNFELPETFFDMSGALCFLSRPNAPSGVCSARDGVERLCASFPGIVVIDEAYVDFAEDNCVDFPKRFNNVIVMRTFSKSFSLAGARLGLAFAHPDIVREFLKTKDSYNLNAITQGAGLAALRDYEHMETNAAKVCRTREALREGLSVFGFSVPKSQANFVLAQWGGRPNAREIFEALRERGILVRYFGEGRLANSLRISVGTDEETAALLSGIREILS